MNAVDKYSVRLATDPAEKRAAFELRYNVFVRELGGNGPLVDHSKQLEHDQYDEHCDHLLLLHQNKSGAEDVVGVYRLMSATQANAASGFYSSTEFDISLLLDSGRRLLEVGRSCLHRDHRGGSGMMVLWSALAKIVFDRKIDILFGVASLHGTRLSELELPLSYLAAHHLAPSNIAPNALLPMLSFDQLPTFDASQKKAALGKVPALIKAYLRLGGGIGKDAFVDKDFNTTDVCLVLDTNSMSPLQRQIYSKGSKS